MDLATDRSLADHNPLHSFLHHITLISNHYNSFSFATDNIKFEMKTVNEEKISLYAR